MKCFKRMQELEKGTNKLFRLVFERLETVDGEILEIKKDAPLLPLRRKRIGLKAKD